MLKVCIEEVKAGNKPHNHFTKLGWANMQKSSIRQQIWDMNINNSEIGGILWKRNDNYGLSLLGRTQVLARMGRRKPLQLVMNGGKPKFRYVLFHENRVFVQGTLLFFCFLCVILDFAAKIVVADCFLEACIWNFSW